MKYNTIYAFRENNESGIRSRQVPVWRGLISIVLSVINSGPNKFVQFALYMVSHTELKSWQMTLL